MVLADRDEGKAALVAFQGYMTVPAELAGHYSALPDVAGFAPRYQRSLLLDVLTPDLSAAPSYGEWDYGKDAVTESLMLQQVWEAQESTLAVDILANHPGTVLDFGAHIGWYTVLAGVFGDHPVIAFEPEPNMLKALSANADRYNVNITYRGAVGPSTPQIEVDGDVALLKCDIEGMDGWAVDACADLFEQHRIRFALIEVSPIFYHDGRGPCDYVAMVGQLRNWGYRVYQIPPKGWTHNDAFREQPLATLKQYRELGSDWADVIAGCRQDNFVFIREEDV